MERSYLVYSTKFMGWVNQTGTYGTDRTAAKTFGQTEALTYCAARFDNLNNVPTCLPVSEDDLIRMETLK